MAKDQSIIGIDIGSSSVKAALLERKAEAVRCVGLHIVKHPEGETATPEHVARALAEIAGVFGKRTNLAALVTGEREIQLKFVDKPPMSRENLDLVLRNEYQASLAHTEEAGSQGFAYCGVGETKADNNTTLQILTAAFPLAHLREQVKMFRQAGLKLVGVFPFAVAARECFLANYLDEIRDQESPYLVALVNFGANSNQVSVCDKQVLRLARTFPFAGEELTQTLVKSYRTGDGQEVALDRNMAEQYKATVGVLSPAEADGYGAGAIEVQVSELVRRGLDRMTQKLRLSLDYFKGQMKTQVSRAYIFGGGANLRGLTDNLGNLLLVNEVHELSPFHRVPFAAEPPFDPEPAPEAKSLVALAVGAGLCGLQRDDLVLNLMSAIKEEEVRRWKSFGERVILPALMVAAIFLVPLGYWWLVLKPAQDQAAALKAEFDRLSNDFNQVATYKNQFDKLEKVQKDLKIRSTFIQSITRRKLFWSRILLAVESMVPREVWLSELTSSAYMEGAGTNAQGTPGAPAPAAAPAPGGESLLIRGRSRTYAALSTFLKNLESTNAFGNLDWKESKREEGGEILFAVTCNIVQAGRQP